MSALFESETDSYYFDEAQLIDITEFENIRATRPEYQTSITWSDMVEQLHERSIREDKDGPLFGPYKLKKGGKRSASSVEHYSALVLDIDSKLQPVPYKSLSPILYKYEHVAYSTHQHTKHQPRYRVVIPFTRSVPVGQYQVVGSSFRKLFGDVVDPSSGNISQAFYLPSCPSSKEKEAFYSHIPGIGLDPSDFLSDTRIENVDTNAINNVPLADHSFPPTLDNIGKITAALNKRILHGDWSKETQWFLALKEMKSLITLAGWPDELVWGLFDTWSQQVGGNYDKVENRNRWDHPDPDSKNPRTFASLLYDLNEYKVEGSIFTAQAQSTLATKRFKLLSVDGLKALPQPAWIVKDVFPEKGLAAVYGPSNSGKTFLALDCGLCIASGEGWFSRAVSTRPVIYVALEGIYGIRQRLEAWELRRGAGVPDTFKLIFDPLSLFRDGDVDEFAKVVNEAGLNGGVIFIDTLNQSAPEADENTSKDMGRILSKAKHLQQLTDSLVILIHHAGKDLGRGLRGHSSLLAALDVAIEVKSDQLGRSWKIAKSKDAPVGVTANFKLSPVVVGQDADGAEITSMIVEPDSSVIFTKHETKKKPKGSNQQIALHVFKSLEQQLPMPAVGMRKKVKLEDAVEAISAALMTEPKRKRERAQAALNGLLASGLIGQKDGYIWLT